MKGNNMFITYVVTFLGATIFLYVRYFVLTEISDLQKDLVGIAFTLLISSLVGIYEVIKSYGKYFWKFLKCKYLISQKKVYVSLSYLLRIKLSGSERYLLVKGNKIEQYQPIGGVYKLVGNKCIQKDWGAEFKADSQNPKDLRFYVDAKQIPSIYKWFISGKNREVGVWREFFEELIETGILKPDFFKNIVAEKLKTVDRILLKENRFQNEDYHTLIYEIFSIELSNEQFYELKKLMNKELFNSEYAFVTTDEIQKGCFDNSKKIIGGHTKYIL